MTMMTKMIMKLNMIMIMIILTMMMTKLMSFRPLVVLCDSAGPGAAFMSISFVSLLSGEQVGTVDI